MHRPVLTGSLLLMIIFLLFTQNAWAVSPDETWESAARAVSGHTKMVNAQTAMEAFERGQGVGRFIVLLKEPSVMANQPGQLRTQQQKLERRSLVQSVRDQALQAMPELPESAIVHRYDNLFGFSVRVSPEQLAVILKNPFVEQVEPVRVLRTKLRQGIPLQGAAKHRSLFTGQGISVAVVDTGIDYNNPYLSSGTGGFPNAKVIGGYDFGELKDDPMDRQGHGTACAGIVAGEPCADCGDYIGGVAQDAKLYALKVTSTPTGVSAGSDAFIAALDWVVTHQYDDPDHPIMVVSISMGGDMFMEACDDALPAMTRAADNARRGQRCDIRHTQRQETTTAPLHPNAGGRGASG